MKKLLLFLLLAVGAFAQGGGAGQVAISSSIPASGPGSGDVVGPASSTNNAFARFSGTTGKLLQDTADLTYSTPTITGPAGFTLATISNGNLVFSPNGTGFVSVVGTGLRLDGTADSAATWGLSGPGFSALARTTTDTSSSGTVATAAYNTLAVPTFAASSTTTFTNAANLYLGGDPAAGSNVTLTDSYGLWNAGKSRFDDTMRLYMFATTKSFVFRRAQGSSSSPSIITSGNALGSFGFEGYNGSGYSQVASINTTAAADWVASTSYPTEVVVNTTNTGATSPSEMLRIKYWGGHLLGVQTSSLPAWGLNGPIWRDNGNTSNVTFTDTSSSGTVATAVGFRHGNPIFAASSTTTFTDAASVYIAGDTRAGTNVTLTNTYGLWNAGKTRMDGAALLTGTATLKFGATAAATIGVSADTTAGVLTFTAPSSGTISLTKNVSSYNGITTAGLGVPVIVAQANITAQSAAATITSYANPATDADFEVSCQLNVSAATSLSAPFQCTYTDVNNVAKTLTFAVQDVDGTGGTFLASGLMIAAAAKTFMTPTMHIRAKASTTITLKAGTGTYTGVTYSASGLIRKLD